ncbi:MAG: fimbrillin family protein [Segatella copri]
MDKKFFMGIAAMAALTLVSCSSDDLNSLSDNSSKNEAISFDGYCGRSAVAVNGSRGSVVDIQALQESTEGFGVFGNNYSSTAEGTPAYGNSLFKNQQVTYDKTKSKWTYSPLRFWPTQGHIDFFAYAPYDSKYADIVMKDNQKLTFRVDPVIENQKDLLYANAVGQTKESISSTGNKVKFQFAHALSKLGYKVKLSGDYSSNATFNLTKITLAGSPDGATKAFYTSGKIDLSKANTASDLWSGYATDRQNFDWFSGTSTVTGTVLKHPNENRAENKDYLFVIPQKFKTGTDKLYVIVTYTITYKNDTQNPITNTVYKQLSNDFEPGKAYMINLTLGLPIEFDATVTDWERDTSIDCTEPWDR